MSPVHLNRSLQWLRINHYIRTHGRSLTILDKPRMDAFAGFHDTYLYPEGPRRPGEDE